MRDLVEVNSRSRLGSFASWGRAGRWLRMRLLSTASCIGWTGARQGRCSVPRPTAVTTRRDSSLQHGASARSTSVSVMDSYARRGRRCAHRCVWIRASRNGSGAVGRCPASGMLAPSCSGSGTCWASRTHLAASWRCDYTRAGGIRFGRTLPTKGIHCSGTSSTVAAKFSAFACTHGSWRSTWGTARHSSRRRSPPASALRLPSWRPWTDEEVRCL
mmetsp:Transcript_89152/g.207484  ORF Transcript_89152/g.207484 Transcript_89152/m.207484 type:complete len:216 (-) Transcript_89152:44-691(-)